MATPLYEVLDICADALILRGWTIPECLAAWPEHEDALSELLPTVMAVRSLSLPAAASDAEPRVVMLASRRRYGDSLAASPSTADSST